MVFRALALTGLLAAAQVSTPAPVPEAPLPGGARWAASVPDRWNGTLILWSRGYSQRDGEPELAPEAVRQALREAGYAIAASNYGAGGWALAEAVPAQRDTLVAFAERHGKPRRVIALGYSMGGLVTTALAEQRPAAIDGAVVMCASIGGAVGMMNMALDGAFAFRTLVAPQSAIRLVGVDDDRANAARVTAALDTARTTPQGRARVALAAVLAGLPGWTTPGTPRPSPDDAEAQAEQMAKTFAMGVFLPRTDQEARAGGAFSWNSGVDYRRQLALSGRQALVARLYRAAGLDLSADLATLAAAPRIAPRAAAVRYMMQHYTPDARPQVPLVAVQAVGDGLTSPSLQRGYAEAVRPVANMRALWVEQAGHCSFTPAHVLTAVRYVEQRVASGRWPARPAGFVDHRPAPMLRPCVRGGACR